MARPKGSKNKKEESGEDEKNPLDSSSDEVEVVSDESVQQKPEEIPAPVAVEAPKPISGSPLGKVRGKDLKNY